jgi:ribulose-phosphate 3-epimerase
MDYTPPQLTASLLCADALTLRDELQALEQAQIDYLHVDMADGHFVPLLGIGIEEAKAVRKATPIPFDVHLLVNNPENWVPRALEELKPAAVTFQAEATDHGYRLAQTIRQHGVLSGVGLNPGTSLSALDCLLPTVDLVLLMTTNPGFTRQSLIPSMLDKIVDLKRLIEAKGLDHPVRISVDGNVSFENAPQMVAAGANVLVSGSSSVFDRSHGSIMAATTAFRERLFEEHERLHRRSDTHEREKMHPFTGRSRQIVAEIVEVLDQVNPREVEQLVDTLITARRVFIFAVGRVLMSLECLGKRLNHLGIDCQVVGAMDEKPIGAEDILLIASGSGESKLPAEIARIAKAKGARLALITSASESTIKSISDVVVHLPCPTKKEPSRGVKSIQLMSTLFDQGLHIFGDALAMQIQQCKQLSHDAVWQRHANLE